MLYRQLEVFRAVIDAGTATAAAQRLDMSQPAVSQHLAQLEEAFGVVLFARERGRLFPTAQALALYDEVAFAFEGIERVVNLAHSFRIRSTGTLRIAVPHSLCEAVLPRMVARFSAAHPMVRYVVELDTYDALVAKVAARQVDVGIAKLPIQHPGVATLPGLECPTVCVLPQAHPLAAAARIRLSDLKGEPLVMIGRHGPWRHEVDALFRRHNLAPNVRLETHAVGAACGFVAGGIGIALLPGLLAQQYRQRAVAIRPLTPTFHHRFAVVYPSTLRLSSVAERFAADLRAVADEIMEAPPARSDDAAVA